MASKEELEEQLERAKEDIATLARMTGSRAANGMSHLRSEIDEHVSQLSEESQALVAQARNKGRRARQVAETQVRDNPLASLGVALATGFILAKLLQR